MEYKDHEKIFSPSDKLVTSVFGLLIFAILASPEIIVQIPISSSFGLFALVVYLRIAILIFTNIFIIAIPT